MPKPRTPIEQMIAEQTNRKAKWEAEQRRLGRKRVSWWVPGDSVPALKAIVARLCRENGSRSLVLDQLRELAGSDL